MTIRSGCLDCPSPSATARRSVGGFFAMLLTRLAEWQERAEQRAHLAGMDERMLKDIGISAADADREARKPFWKA